LLWERISTELVDNSWFWGYLNFRARYPSGKGEVCKTFMRRFDSDPRLQPSLLSLSPEWRTWIFACLTRRRVDGELSNEEGVADTSHSGKWIASPLPMH
jgi:hypothetical protein